MKLKPKYLLLGLLFGIVTAASVMYAIWQYNLCYPEVSSSTWYCIQHAFGG